MKTPKSTYRVQVRESFDLHATAGIVDYLARLGVDWVYSSPLLASVPGSDHGYDVVDTSRIDFARGGATGLIELSSAVREHGMGLLVDIVPNHMGVASPRHNPWWWDLLTHGESSRFADAFDVDWAFGNGRIRIPVLDNASGTALDELSIVDGELAYFDHRYPIAPGTADDGASAAEVHDRQHYELVDWRRADDELNYRRFFAVSTLAAIRVEVPWVFAEAHAEVTRWISAGLVDGLRIDHPDGLADPGRYLDALATATGSAFVLAEKILEGDERFPAHWQAAGTTGYDALGDIDRLLVDPAGAEPLGSLDARLRGVVDHPDLSADAGWADLTHDTRRAIADGILRSEILRIARLVPQVDGADDAIAELTACFPVYRSYLPYGAAHLADAMDVAATRRPDLASVLAELAPILGDAAHPAAVRMQQTSGMVMAKGVEDTAFYRYSRLVSLNEVGADPSEFSIGIDEFHERQQVRQACFPSSMTTLSTHDTKRGEDVRARIDVVSEVPGEWARAMDRLLELEPFDDGPLANLLWQTIVGAWPASRGRLHAYAKKAAREAGNSTTWTAPDTQFESRMHAVVDSVFDNPSVAAVIGAIVDRIRAPGWSNSLSAKLIQLTAPGVPDVYQGSELWETSLVDPDNRRPVDFAVRRRILDAIDAGAHPPIDESGATKLLVTTRALRLRRDRPELFTRYLPVPAVGEAAEHVVAFDRGGAITVATRLPIGLAGRGGWGDTAVLVPGRAVADQLTDRILEGGRLPMAALLDEYPVALLTAVGDRL